MVSGIQHMNAIIQGMLVPHKLVIVPRTAPGDIGK